MLARAEAARLIMATSFSTRVVACMSSAEELVRRNMKVVILGGIGEHPGWFVGWEVAGEGRVMRYVKLLYLKGNSG